MVGAKLCHFQGQNNPLDVTTTITLNRAEELKEDLRQQKTRALPPPSIDYTVPWGYFDGPCQGHPQKC